MFYENSRELSEELAFLSDRLNTLQKKMAMTARLTTKAEPLFIGSPSALGEQLNERRKALGIDLYALELQTNISTSTLKRLFKDPEQVKFGSVLTVAKALGMKLCTVA